jgi:glycosyltransferase involved in cell wall biosynthesis
MCKALVSCGADIIVLTTNANLGGKLSVLSNTPITVNGVNVIYFNRITGDHSHVAPRLWWYLLKNVTPNDVVHIHSWWSPLVVVASIFSLLKTRNVILSPRGMLSNYSLKSNYVLKFLFNNLVSRFLFYRMYFHATSSLEFGELKKYSSTNRIFTVPNFNSFPSISADRIVLKSTCVKIGFISRIEKKKGLEFLLNNLSKQHTDFKLFIAGEGDSDYLQSLKKLASDLSLSDKIEWVGWLNGVDKISFIRSMDVIMLLSYNENFANVVLESLSVGVPVFISSHVGLNDFVSKFDLGWVCEMNDFDFQRNFDDFLRDEGKSARIMVTSQQIVNSEFNSDVILGLYLSMYKDIVLSNEK